LLFVESLKFTAVAAASKRSTRLRCSTVARLVEVEKHNHACSQEFVMKGG